VTPSITRHIVVHNYPIAKLKGGIRPCSKRPPPIVYLEAISLLGWEKKSAPAAAAGGIPYELL